jgi:phosphopantothenoylcysteine synthetase/decarboxylase
MSKFKEHKQTKILFCVTGSIAAFKACAAISQLLKEDYEVRTVATQSALKFIGTATLEGLTGKPVATDLYAEGEQMAHIHLARWADLIVVAPCSATTVAKLAHGLADNLLSSIALANNFKKPLLIAPAMNTEMYDHPATQRNLQTLKDWGVLVLDSPSGVLACGEYGAGRMVEATDLVSHIKGSLKKEGRRK